mmetsp:Transcript_25974/g.58264  ORF Transcript_25974/g.58264 Transcript_25974/m.58264 type:complete len:1141 (+) Transcript_25974:342-3764(+)
MAFYRIATMAGSVACALIALAQAAAAVQSNAENLASNLSVTLQLGKNFGHDKVCPMADWGFCFTLNLILDYNGSEDYLDSGFKIYFSSIRRLLQVETDSFGFEHVVGDLTYIMPTFSFNGFKANSQITIPMVLEYWSTQETDMMPRWFVVDERDKSSAVIPNTDTENLRDFVVPYTSTVRTTNDVNKPASTENRYLANKSLRVVSASDRIVPKPFRTVVSPNAQSFRISSVSLSGADSLSQLQDGVSELMSKLGIETTDYGGHPIALTLGGSLPGDIAGVDEAYIMDVKSIGTTIIATDAAGLFNGLMSFLGLLDVNDMTIKEVTVQDKPRFPYRGHQIDAARNFRSKETVLKTLDVMALYKMNVLHFALTNDEGWRLEIPGLDELTDVGSKRCFDPNEETCLLTQLGSGPDAGEKQFYSRQDYIDILKYADARNVQIIPEFNMPAHARAAVVAMEARAKNGDATYRLTDPEDETYLLTVQFYDRTSIINPCLDSSVEFVKKLVREVKQMHTEAGVSLDSYHFGGDEAKNILLKYDNYPSELKQRPFSKSPACEAKAQADPSFNIEKIANYWAGVVGKILAEEGINEMVAWQDGLTGTTKGDYTTPSVAVNLWDTIFWGATDTLVRESEAGFDLILSNPDFTYFDFPYEINVEERGYYWASRANSMYKVFTFAPENLPQNAETALNIQGNPYSVTTPEKPAPVIRGMQGQTWSETIRTDAQYDEMTFPRAVAIAERAWHRANWELDWSSGVVFDGASTDLVPKGDLASDYNTFASAMGCRETTKLAKLGVMYRVPPPGAKVDGSGLLFANTEMPCTKIMYSTNEGLNWMEYTEPVTVGSANVWLQSQSGDGALLSRVAKDTKAPDHGCISDSLPELSVPHCNRGVATATIDKRLGTLEPNFPRATVDVCFTHESLELVFKAFQEKTYLINETFVNNDPIWKWTVMEAFIGPGDSDPTQYFEFEVAPNNVLWTGFIHNPYKDFTSKATALVDDHETYPITSFTSRDEASQTWQSDVSLPLTMFNVDSPEGSSWRMNFLRTYYASDTAEQEYGAWSPNKMISFHQTPCFGRVKFEGEVDSQQPKADAPSPDNNSNNGGSSNNWQPTVNENDWDWKPTPSRGFATSLLVPAAIICLVFVYATI